MRPRAGRPRRALAAVAILAGAFAPVACGGGDPQVEPDTAEPFVARPPLAGVSANVEFQVDSIRPGDFGRDTVGTLWSRFNHRCSGCHVAPSPAQHPAGSWAEVVDRMGEHVESAGLLTFDPEETGAIVDLLDRHAPPAEGSTAD